MRWRLVTGMVLLPIGVVSFLLLPQYAALAILLSGAALVSWDLLRR